MHELAMHADERTANADDSAATAPPKGRLAPSPSGRMHLGNVFSCLMAWLAAKSQGGSIALRIEDIDPRASKRELALQLIDDLAWLGIDWDEGPVYQSDRLDHYRDCVEGLKERGLVYPCFCTRAELHAASAPHASDGTYVYPGTCRNLTPAEVAAKSAVRNPALRLRVPAPDEPGGTVHVEDAVFGAFDEVLACECGDFLVQRSDGVFAYQLAVTADDGAMGVTQVVRGRDLLGSVARQMHLQDLLGLPHPAYIHVPLLVAPDGRRLSKRDADLDLGVLRRRYAGPQAIIGRLAASIGLADPGEELGIHELRSRFTLDALRSHSADIVVDEDYLP